GNGFRKPCEDQNTNGRIRAGALVEPAAREHVKIGIPFGVNVGRSCFIIDKSQFSEKTALAHGCQMAVVPATGSRIQTPPRRTRNISSPESPVEKSLFSLFNETSETHSLIFDNSSSENSRNKEKSFSSKSFPSVQWRLRAQSKFALPSIPLRCPLCRKSSRL